MLDKIIEFILLFLTLVATCQPRPPGPPGGGGTVTCTGTCGFNLTGQYRMTTNATHRIIYTNGIPNHPYYVTFPAGNVKNPNGVCEHFRKMTVPLNPTLGTSVTALSLGPVGILTTGGFLYNHLDGPETSDNDLALPNRAMDMDSCNGHPDPTCRYHYHKNPEKCIANYGECLLIGYLADGFPVYSYCNVSGTRLRSCYDKVSGAAGTDTSHFFFNASKVAAKQCQLDEANGYCFQDGVRGILSGRCRYGYVLTEDYPFVVPSSAGSVYYGLEPITSFPVTPAPVKTTARPSTAKATTARPTTGKPMTAKPMTTKVTTAKPSTAKPTTAKVMTAKPMTARPTTARPK